MSEAARILEEQEEQTTELDEFQDILILDDASAEMVLKQLKQAEDQYDRMKAWYDHQIKNLKEIRDRTRLWAEGCLRPYFDMVPTTGNKIKSYDMPGGTLKLSKQDPEFEIDDEKLVPWLEKNNLTDFIKKEAKWGDFKETLKDEKKRLRMVPAEDGNMEVVTANGEVIPGIKGVVREPKFSVKTK